MLQDAADPAAFKPVEDRPGQEIRSRPPMQQPRGQSLLQAAGTFLVGERFSVERIGIGPSNAMRLDVDALTEAELIDLNNRIVARLRFLQQKPAHSAMLEFRIGDRVAFRPEGRAAVVGGYR